MFQFIPALLGTLGKAAATSAGSALGSNLIQGLLGGKQSRGLTSMDDSIETPDFMSLLQSGVFKKNIRGGSNAV